MPTAESEESSDTEWPCEVGDTRFQIEMLMAGEPAASEASLGSGGDSLSEE